MRETSSGRPEERRRRDGEDDARIRGREQQSAERRAGKAPDALDRAGGYVRRSQLLGAARKRRESGRLGGPEGHGDDARPGGERVDQGGWASANTAAAATRQRGGSHEVCCEHDALAPEAVGDDPRERSGDRRREKADQPDEPDGCGPARLVGVDREGDRVRPIAGDRAGPGELDATQVGVAEDVGERRRRLAQPLAHELAHALEDRRLYLERQSVGRCGGSQPSSHGYRARIPRAEKGGLVEEESTQGQEEADVEGHLRRQAEGFEPPEKEKRESDESEAPDVEGHLKRA